MNVTSPSCFCDAVVAVIDTGVDFYHSDLMVNTVRSIDCLTIEAGTAVCKPGGNDDNGHGTHVAGTIGAINSLSGVVGVCPGAEIWSLKVLNVNGTGFKSSVLAAVDYVAKYNDTIDVANLSLGAVGTSSCDSTYCSAITKAKNAGVAFSVSAGNSNTTVDFASPACCADVLTVSALSDSDGAPGRTGGLTCSNGTDDTIASFSNYGSLIDIAAPGDCILSTLRNERTGRMSGTSMASPHVAGALAILASNNHSSDVDTMYATITSNGNYNYTDKPFDAFKEPLLDLRNLPDPKIVCGTRKPSRAPTKRPTKAPTKKPTKKPTKAPTKAPTKSPTKAPTKAPTRVPTRAPTVAPTSAPTVATKQQLIIAATEAPTTSPTEAPTKAPTKVPSKAPTKAPTMAPTRTPTKFPTKSPTQAPSKKPTKAPTKVPSKAPTKAPTMAPTRSPTKTPTKKPTLAPATKCLAKGTTCSTTSTSTRCCSGLRCIKVNSKLVCAV